MKIYVAFNDQILIPQEDGFYRVVKNSEWIPAFYALPAEIMVNKRIQKIGNAYEKWADEDLGFEKKTVIDYENIIEETDNNSKYTELVVKLATS